jgi:hypothetical protein
VAVVGDLDKDVLDKITQVYRGEKAESSLR